MVSLSDGVRFTRQEHHRTAESQGILKLHHVNDPNIQAPLPRCCLAKLSARGLGAHGVQQPHMRVYRSRKGASVMLQEIDTIPYTISDATTISRGRMSVCMGIVRESSRRDGMCKGSTFEAAAVRSRLPSSVPQCRQAHGDTATELGNTPSLFRSWLSLVRPKTISASR